jgi:pimeloyl-ACP methyl ester carboxylesterase
MAAFDHPAPSPSAQFTEAYDAVLRQWPVPVEQFELLSAYGTTHVNACGPQDAPPLLLLHGGGATSTVWFANVKDLSADHRVYAIDTIGDAGRSVHDGKPVKSRDDLMDWLDAVLLGLGTQRVHICGHSYGAWLALNYAMHAPQNVRRLALLDPTQCFASFSFSYLRHAVPVVLQPNAARNRTYLAWETGGVTLDPAWQALFALGASFPKSKVVPARKLLPEKLRNLTTPTLVLLAELSKAHDINRVEAKGRKSLAQATFTTLPGASHHTLPMAPATEVNRRLAEFLS